MQFLLLAGVALWILDRLVYGHTPGRQIIGPHWVVDYLLCVINLFVIGTSFGLFLACLYRYFVEYLPWLDLRLINCLPVALQCVVTYMAIDFVSYVSHRIRHRVEWLWLFHSIHHSQEVMNPLTNLRSHPVDEIVHRTLHAIPFFMLGGNESFWLWFGALDTGWGYFVHADIQINLGPLKYIIVTPQYHRIHHSLERQHWNKNFSNRLVIWDYLFGTRYPGTNEYPATGIEGYPVQENSYRPWRIALNLIGHFVYPFEVIARSIRQADAGSALPDETSPPAMQETASAPSATETPVLIDTSMRASPIDSPRFPADSEAVVHMG
jgi:sterol desaturase/sphingolipid hydroxylase (fatty acid hydroxylase superfamily)